MSIQAVSWALEDAVGVDPDDGSEVDVPAECVAVLVALANRAGEDGRDAYPSVHRLAHAARKTERSVQRDLEKLERLGIIRRGDQRAVFRFRSDRRPTVWDLAMERRRAPYRSPWATDRDEPGTDRRGDAGVTSLPVAPPTSGVTPTTERGDVHVASGVTPTSPKPSSGTTPRTSGESSAVVSPEQRVRERTSLPPTAELDPSPRPVSGPPAELGGRGHAAFLRARAVLACRRCDSGGLLESGVACTHPRRDEGAAG
jgi:hypothetical protein